jgi:hypothetical protein
MESNGRPDNGNNLTLVRLNFNKIKDYGNDTSIK